MARGGKRAGSGRKAKWGEATVSIRVPVSLVDEVKTFIERRVSVLNALGKTKPNEPIQLWQAEREPGDYDRRRCQATTKAGTRCSYPMEEIRTITLPDGRQAEVGLCKRHTERQKGGIAPGIYPTIINEFDTNSFNAAATT